MKAITPVISIILLIMITISVVAFFFAFFGDFMSGMFNQTEEHATQQQIIMGTDFELIDVSEKAGNVSIIVRNIGTVSIMENVALIIAKDPNGKTIGTKSNPSVIEKNSLVTIDTEIDCPGGQDITVTVDIYGKKHSEPLTCSGAATTTTTVPATTTTTSTTTTSTSTTTTSTTTTTTIPAGSLFYDDFEVDFGNWANATGDDFDWERHSGSTSSSNTGPSSAHGGSYYIYTEASGASYRTAILLGPTIDFDAYTNEQIDFWYHMYGAGMGDLYLEEDTTGSWVTLWSMSGDQGDQWYNSVIDLSGLSGTGTLRFRGVTENYVTSDMALDDISITGDTGGPTTTTTSTTTTTTTILPTTTTTTTTTIPTCDSNLVGHCTSYDGITAIGQTQVFDGLTYTWTNSCCGGENWCIGRSYEYATRAFTGLALSNADVDVSVDVWGLQAGTNWQIWISNDNSAWTQCGDTYETPSGSTTYTMSRTCSGFTGTEMYVKVIMTDNAGNVRESINNFRVIYPPCNSP